MAEGEAGGVLSSVWYELSDTLLILTNICWAAVMLYYLMVGRYSRPPNVVPAGTRKQTPASDEHPHPAAAPQQQQQQQQQKQQPSPRKKKKAERTEDLPPALAELRELQRKYERCKVERDKVRQELSQADEKADKEVQRVHAESARVAKLQEEQEKEIQTLRERLQKKKEKDDQFRKRLTQQGGELHSLQADVGKAEEARAAEDSRREEIEEGREAARREKEQAERELARARAELQELKMERVKRKDDARFFAKENEGLRQDVTMLRARVEAGRERKQRREAARAREQQQREERERERGPPHGSPPPRPRVERVDLSALFRSGRQQQGPMDNGRRGPPPPHRRQHDGDWDMPPTEDRPGERVSPTLGRPGPPMRGEPRGGDRRPPPGACSGGPRPGPGRAGEWDMPPPHQRGAT